MKRILLATRIVSLAWLTQACFGVEYRETLKISPTSGSDRSFLGEWRSASVSFPTPQTCSDLKWTVTSQNGPNIAGNFEATCGGGAVKLTGTATAVIEGHLRIDAVGTATGFGSTPCSFSLTGTGVLQSDSSIRVDYTGQTCIGPISGTEVIRR